MKDYCKMEKREKKRNHRCGCQCPISWGPTEAGTSGMSGMLGSLEYIQPSLARNRSTDPPQSLDSLFPLASPNN